MFFYILLKFNFLFYLTLTLLIVYLMYLLFVHMLLSYRNILKLIFLLAKLIIFYQYLFSLRFFIFLENLYQYVNLTNIDYLIFTWGLCFITVAYVINFSNHLVLFWFISINYSFTKHMIGMLQFHLTVDQLLNLS